MGNAGIAMEHDACIFKNYCVNSNKAWCNDFKILEQSYTICLLFENIIKLSEKIIKERNFCPHGTMGGKERCMACRTELRKEVDIERQEHIKNCEICQKEIKRREKNDNKIRKNI